MKTPKLRWVAFRLTLGLIVAAVIIAIYPKENTYYCDPKVFEALMSEYPLVVNLSPDKQKILLKTRYASDFEVAVYDRITSRVLNSTRSNDTQLSLTWNPSNREIIFQSSRSGSREFEMFLWDTESSGIFSLDVPIT
jgi:hypothetical protein